MELSNSLSQLFPPPTDDEKLQANRLTNDGIVETKNYGLIATNGDFWNCGPLENRTWLWTLHAFLLLDPLIAVKDAVTVLRLISEWRQQFESRPIEDDFPWHDHATALRLDRLSRLAIQLPGCRLTDLAGKHANTLMREDFYSRNTNHGFDQTLALILASQAFPEHPDADSWKNVGMMRLQEEIRFAFTEEGVHVENSPAYHMGMISNLARARRLLQVVDAKAVPAEIESLFDKALCFLAWITRPDRFVSYIGDSSSYRPNVPAELADIPHFPLVKYVASGGQDGVASDESFAVYEKSGYAIYRSRWAPWEGHTHIVMKCGFLSGYHRQDDDLNVLLHARGEDWLIDSGLYNHNQKDPVRVYMRSVLAHNVPYVPGVRINRSTPGCEAATLEKMERDGYQFAAQAMTRMYAGGRVFRQLLIRNEDEFKLVDRFAGHQDQPRYWLFHIPADKKVSFIPNGCRISGSRADLILKSSAELACRVSKGFSNEFPSVSSLSFNQKSDSQVIVFGPSLDSQMVFSFRLRSKA